MRKRKAIILFIILFATVSAFGIAPRIVPKKHCIEVRYCAEHLKCVPDIGLNKIKCSQAKKAELQAKKNAKDGSKSIFSGLFSFDFPKLPLEDFILSAQKALAEKMF